MLKQVEETYEPYKKCALDVVQNLPMWEQNYNRACDNAKTVAGCLIFSSIHQKIPRSPDEFLHDLEADLSPKSLITII